MLTVPWANAEILIWTHSANTLHDSRMAVDRGMKTYRTIGLGAGGADDGLQQSWVNLTPGWVLPIPSILFRLHAHFLAWKEKKGSGWEESPLPACWSTAQRTQRQTSWKWWGWSVVFHLFLWTRNKNTSFFVMAFSRVLKEGKFSSQLTYKSIHNLEAYGKKIQIYTCQQKELRHFASH